MKRLLLIAMALTGLLTACRDPVGGNPDDTINNPGTNQNAVVVFDNSAGSCAAVVYDDYRRRDGDKRAEIPAGAKSPEIPWTPGALVPFYFSYTVSFKGSSGFTLNLIPNPKSGKDQTTIRIDADDITYIPIPALSETVSSPDSLLSDNSYLFIQNDSSNSSYSFQLYRYEIIQPVNLSSPLVIPGKGAQYTINPGPTSPYRLQTDAGPVLFPGSFSFEAGRVYYFSYYNGDLSLNSEYELKLENILTIPGIYAAPIVTAGNGQLTLRWQAAEGASAYEVWTATRNNPAMATKWGPDFSGTSAVVTGLTNGTTYYVWIQAKNSVGRSGFGPGASGTPSAAFSNPPPSVSLYKGAIANNNKIVSQNLDESLEYISANAISGDEYFIVFGADESVFPMSLNYSGKTVGITLLGEGGERTINLVSTGSIFTVNAGVTLTLGENITLVLQSDYYNNYNNAPLVSLGSGGSLIINDGAKISENAVGSGIYVSGGTVTMNGGTISRNRGDSSIYEDYTSNGGGIYVESGIVTMNGGTISENGPSGKSYGFGGGIYVGSNGTFTMNSGTISGNYNDGIHVSGGTVTMNSGTISGNGGGIYVEGGTFTMKGGTISENVGNCGIYVYSNGTVTMNSGTISKNNGSGIWVYGGTFTMNSGTISGHTTPINGGGIFVEGGTVTMNGGTISGNTATSNGGGIFVCDYSGGASAGGGTFTMNGGTISGNTAYTYGGGIYAGSYYSGDSVGGGNVAINGGTISGNTITIPLEWTSYNGGGVYFNSSGTFKLGGTAKIFGNTKSETANNVYLASSCYITLGTGANGVAAPQNGMNVYVQSSGIIVNTGATSAAAQYFHADQSGKEVVLSGTQLVISAD